MSGRRLAGTWRRMGAMGLVLCTSAGCGVLFGSPSADHLTEAIEARKRIGRGDIEAGMRALEDVFARAEVAEAYGSNIDGVRESMALALVSVGRVSEALALAEVMRPRAPGSSANVLGTAALAGCRFNEATRRYLEVMATSATGHVAATSNLANVDLAEGRLVRAEERLKALGALRQPAGSLNLWWESVQENGRNRLAMLGLRLGRAATDLAEAYDFDATVKWADFALTGRSQLYSAYRGVATAILVATALGRPDLELNALRDRLGRIVDAYPSSGDPCRSVIPDPLAAEPAGVAQRLLPARYAAAEAVAPLPDQDGDGIPDADDKCPDQREVVNGVDDSDGCPDEAAGYLEGREIRLKEQIHFVTGSARIDERSAATLDWLAGFIRGATAIVKVSIEGHTDDVGDDDANQRLSERRAEAVFTALVERGLDRDRLGHEGFGETIPKVLGTSTDARAANRRVEIVAQLRGP